MDAINKLREKQCPNIVNIHDVWTEWTPSEKLYIQTDWVGTTLRDLLRLQWTFEGPFWFDIVWAITHGISQAHQYNIVHGDLKPANGSPQMKY
jgi:serine/threonine protein kinase